MSKKIMLRSSDGEAFEIEEAAASQSQTIAHMIEDDCVGSEIPLANVKGTILAMVIEYCNKHAGTDASTSEGKEELKKWDADFLNTMEQPTLFYVILAANYLNIKDLLDISCQAVADMISGKTSEEIRAILGILNDFTPEEEEEMRKENQWAFQ